MPNQSPSSTPLPPAAVTWDIGVDGMSCTSCATRIERALSQVPGVIEASVNLATESVRVVAQAGTADGPLRRAIRVAGYRPRAPQQAWRAFAPVGCGLALALPLMLPMVLPGEHAMLPPALQCALATPVQFILGARFYRAAWQAVKAGVGNMDLLVSVGTTAAWGLSMWLWLARGHTHLYFEASAMVIALVLLGKWLEARAKHQASAAIRALQALRPQQAHVLNAAGEEADVPLHEVLCGDRLVVRPGEAVPADGLVEEGQTQVNESMLTGEPLPVERGPGGHLTAGSVNGEARVVMRTTAVGGDTVLAHIIRRVEDAQAAKSPIQRQVDRVSAVFVPSVLGLAALTFLLWLAWGAGFEAALIHAVAVLVIACPCALGLATPAALIAGTGAAARHGILIKDPQALETAHRVDTVAFDKTGTLTVGQPRLVAFVAAPQVDAQQALRAAAGLQSGSEHPLAHAVLLAAREQGVQPAAVHNSRAVPGRGTQGELDGQTWRIASARWLHELPVDGSALALAMADWQKDGATVSVLLKHNQLQALLAFRDEPKPMARAALAQLRQQGLRLAMISGDNHAAALAMAQRVGLNAAEVLAPVQPEEKAAALEQLRHSGCTHSHRGSPNTASAVVAMVGDGINDAPALASADVGMAMGTGTDVAMQAAGITLMRGDLMLVAAALDISHRTVAKIRQNLFWALAYNVAGIPLAALGYLSPVVAGAAMALSSVSVISNALLLTRWRPPQAEAPPHRAAKAAAGLL